LRTRLFLFVGRLRAFWRLRAQWQHSLFIWHRSIWGFISRVADDRRQSSTFFKLTRSTFAQIALSVAIALAVQILGPHFDEFLQISMLQITSDAYTNLLSGVAGTGGVLIGLYYAATTAIAGAIYSRVPNDVRSLFSKDHVGNVYMRFLALLTYTSLVLLAFRASGLPPVRTAIVLLGVGAGISIIGFVRLGARAFNLFDPTTLLSELLERIHRSFVQSKAGAFRWNDPSFQNYSSQNARTAIDTIAALADITAKEAQLNGEAFLAFCRSLLALLIEYQSAKKKIPNDSRWYPVRYAHPDWYRSSDNATSLAHQTAGRLEPTLISDTQWVESSIFPIIQTCMSTNFAAGRQTLVVNLASYIDAYLQARAFHHEVRDACELASSVVEKFSHTIFTRESMAADREPLEQLALADAIASWMINIFLAYLRAISTYDRAFIDRSVREIRWDSRVEIYKADLPQHAIKQLEWLYPRIEFESRSEGTKITPNWYVGELVRLSAVDDFKAAMLTLVTEARSAFNKWVSNASKNELIWVKATFLAREAEYWQKLDSNFSKLESHWRDLNSPRFLEGLSWAELDLAKLRVSISDCRKEVIVNMADVGATLSASERPDTYPDFAGQFLHAVGEQFLSALIANDVASADALFPHIFAGALRQYDRLAKKIDLADWRSEIASKVAVAPVLDVMQLTGYCILFAELYENELLAKSVLRAWTTYLDLQVSANVNILAFLSAAIGITETPFELAHRSLIRMAWKQRVARELEKLSPDEGSRARRYSRRHANVQHKSSLVRVFARDGFVSFYDGIDIFIERLVRERPNAADFNQSPRRRNLHDAIKREERLAAQDGEQRGEASSEDNGAEG
jgi:hypothetical protein